MFREMSPVEILAEESRIILDNIREYGWLREYYFERENDKKGSGSDLKNKIREFEEILEIPKELSFLENRKENLLAIPLTSGYYFHDHIDDDFEH